MNILVTFQPDIPILMLMGGDSTRYVHVHMAQMYIWHGWENDMSR
jgi:hypothetical protein